MAGTEGVRALAAERFGRDKTESLLDELIERGAPIDKLEQATSEAPDFASWRYDMEDWLDFIDEAWRA